MILFPAVFQGQVSFFEFSKYHKVIRFFLIAINEKERYISIHFSAITSVGLNFSSLEMGSEVVVSDLKLLKLELCFDMLQLFMSHLLRNYLVHLFHFVSLNFHDASDLSVGYFQCWQGHSAFPQLFLSYYQQQALYLPLPGWILQLHSLHTETFQERHGLS